MLKRSVSLAGHRTSIALEPQFWAALERLAARRGLALAQLIERIDAGDPAGNLASALRLAILADLEARTDPTPQVAG